MSGNARRRRSTWDNKEENQISARTGEQGAWRERESYPRHHGHDPKSYDLESDNAMKSRDFPERPSREQSPRRSIQRDAKRDSYDMSRSKRSADVAKSYPVSPRNHGPGRQNHMRSPEEPWDHPHRRSRSRSRGRGRGGSRSPSGGRNRSRSLSRGRDRDRGYTRSRSPLIDYRRDPHGGFNDRRRGFGAPPQARIFTAGDGRRGSQDRDGGRSGRDQAERWGTRGERGGSHYDVERQEPARKSNSNICNDFLNGRCLRGSSCRFSHDGTGDNSLERQHYIAPCKFFMMGNCSRSNCRFSHDAPMQDDRGGVSRKDGRDHDYGSKNNTRDDRRDHDYGSKNSTRDDRRDQDFGSMNRKWNLPKWGDVAGGLDLARLAEWGSGTENAAKNNVGWGGSDTENVARDVGWGGSGTENVESTDRINSERDNYDKLDRLDDKSNIWAAPDSYDVDMNIAGLKAPKEITKVEPQSTFDSTPYESSPASKVSRSALPENSELYSGMEGNILTACGFDPDDDGDVHLNAKQTDPMPAEDFNQKSDAYGLPAQQSGGISQDQLVNSANSSDEHNDQITGPVQENISPFKVQKPIDTEMIDTKPEHLSNLPPSLTEKFVNEQLPQLYAALNPPKPAVVIPSFPDSAGPFPPLSSNNTKPDHTSIYQKRNVEDMEPKKLENSNNHPGLFSNSIAQNGSSVNTHNMSSETNPQKTIPKPVTEKTSKPIVEKPNQEPGNENNGARNIEADTKGDGAEWKDEKAMRLFKNSLVDFVKDILKPKWKEGGMSRDVHKAIVKKVVEKVTNATQGINIPSTQAKLDQYLQTSKPKLAKLVEAYVERYAKTS